MEFNKSGKIAALVVCGLFIGGCVASDLKVTTAGSGTGKVSAKTGIRTELAGFFKVNGNCSGTNPGTLKIVNGPSHGTTDIVREMGSPTYVAGHPLQKCNSYKVSKVAAYYKSTPGYVGADKVTVSSKAAGSDVYSYVTFYIDVEK